MTLVWFVFGLLIGASLSYKWYSKRTNYFKKKSQQIQRELDTAVNLGNEIHNKLKKRRTVHTADEAREMMIGMDRALRQIEKEYEEETGCPLKIVG